MYSSQELGGYHSSPITTPEGNRKNVMLEAFLLHYRNLRAFLCPSIQAHSDDDIVASDFLGIGEASDVADATKLKADKTKIDGMLAHLTYRRAEYIRRGVGGWDVAGMTVTLLEQLERFLEQLPDNLKAWFPSAHDISESRQRAENFRGLFNDVGFTTSNDNNDLS
jgi:hypothetical protein